MASNNKPLVDSNFAGLFPSSAGKFQIGDIQYQQMRLRLTGCPSLPGQSIQVQRTLRLIFSASFCDYTLVTFAGIRY